MKRNLAWKALEKLLLIFLVLYILLPILVPLIFSFSRRWTDIFPEGLTTQWYQRVLSKPAYYRGLMTSLFVAITAVSVDIFVCVPAAYAINRLRGGIGNALRVVFKILPLIFPPIVVGTAFLRAFNRPPVAWSGSLVLTIFAHATLGFPFMFRNVLAAFQTIDERTLSEAAASLGANLWQRFRYILIPNVIPGVLSGSLLVFAISMGEFEVTLMIAGFGWKTLPLLLYRSLIDDVRTASAISGILVATSVLAFLGMTLISTYIGAGRMRGIERG